MSLDSRSREYREYVEAYLKDFYAQFHDAPQKALSDGNACGLPRAPDPAAGDDLAAAAEDDDPAVSGGKILYHSFDPAGKQDDLPVSRVFQPRGVHDPVSDGQHHAVFVRARGRIPALDGGTDQRDDVPVRLRQFHQRLFQLAEPPRRAPIVDVASRYQPESARICVALHPFQGNFALISLR